MSDQTFYEVDIWEKPKNIIVSVPGSKSITNRALLLAALAKGKSILNGVQFSKDSRCFLKSLGQLGFYVEVSESSKRVVIEGHEGKIPNKEAEIYVGSAGTAARFLTAMLAFSDGKYKIQCSEQMKKRPMKTLFQSLEKAGASFEYLGEKEYLPVIVTGNKRRCSQLTMDISESTQFLSAALLTAPMLNHTLEIQITSEKKTGSYIEITRKMLQDWGIVTSFEGDRYKIAGDQILEAKQYFVEPDVSGACYFYAAAAMTGSQIMVNGIHWGLMQGDMRFLKVLEKMGCEITDTPEGICVVGPKEGYDGICLDMNNFSDQALTLAAIAPFAKTPTVIKNIGHIRLQECDRIKAIEENMTRMGIRTDVKPDEITIYPGKVHAAEIETYDDHRVAMAFSLVGLKVSGIKILNPECCAKTFENYFTILDEIKSNT